jgi:hypothetical protein
MSLHPGSSQAGLKLGGKSGENLAGRAFAAGKNMAWTLQLSPKGCRHPKGANVMGMS